MSVQQLRMLREVATRGTIAAAAESLGYTPSAVSQQLNGLEKTAGVAVLERVGRNVRLTDAGRELVRHAVDLLAGLESARAAMERVTSEVRGVLEINVYGSVAATLLVPLLQRVARGHPDLRLRTREMDADAAMDALASGELDLAFALDYPHASSPQREGVVRDSVLEDFFRLVVPEGDPVTGTRVPLRAVARRRFISSPRWMSCRRCVVTACRAAGFEPDITHQIDDYATTVRLVGAGEGISLVPDLALIDVHPGLRVLEIDPPVSRTIELAYRKASADRPAIVAVRNAVSEVIRDLAVGRSTRSS